MHRKFLVSFVLVFFLISCQSPEKKFNTHIERAKSYVKEHKLKAAIIEYKNAIKINPKAVVPHFELGRLYYQIGSFRQAVSELRRQ